LNVANAPWNRNISMHWEAFMSIFKQKGLQANSIVSIGMGLLSAVTIAPTTSHAQGVPQRLQQLEAAVAALQTNALDVEANVSCDAGQSISDVLAMHARGQGRLTINVTGVCDEVVTISRSGVAIVGQGAGAAITSPSTAFFTAIVDSNVRDVSFGNLTISGSNTAALLVHKGAQAVARNVVVEHAPSGVMALDNGVLDVAQSTLRNNGQGAYASRGGVVTIGDGSVVEANTVGALAWKAGNIVFTSTAPDFAPSSGGVVVRNNVNGAVARSGGFLEFASTTIENNTANGVVADTGGSVHFFGPLAGIGNVVRNNANNGVFVNKSASLVISDATMQITANTRGILCQGNPGYLVPPGFMVTGNTFGDILGCTP
jgi:hypothetical protein